MLKEHTEDYQIPSNDQVIEPDLKGLSCRWEAVPNARGCILTLLVSSRASEDSACYAEVIQRLSEITQDITGSNPIHSANMSCLSIAGCLRNECRFHSKRFTHSFIFRAFEIVAAVLVFKYKVPPFFFDPRHYEQAMSTHADYRKFDDTLRMVLDCRKEAVSKVRAYLESQRERGELLYGLHVSSSSLMTCYVHDVSDGNHIHFVDGGDGGYAMAARELKAQLAEV
jgi:hypothetical protein